ncbi:MAG: HEAT repeat domain-containing protein [Planctomycetes bacterium]|nr:HEAT repeat domain-containing protein [Planctomycetota bacterium]
MSQSGILVECLCEAKYEVSNNVQGQGFTCDNCGRQLRVPTIEWNARYVKQLERLEEGADPQRSQAYREIAKLGTPASLPALQRGLYDPSREVVNTCLHALMITRYGRDHLLDLMEQGILKMARIVAMIRETRYEEGPDILCDLIDAGRFNENQIMETIQVLGEAGRARCIPTLKNLRKAYPNLAMLVDNALSNYRDMDEEIGLVPEDAKRVDAENVEMLSQYSTAEEKRGCMKMLVLLALPSVILLLLVMAG